MESVPFIVEAISLFSGKKIILILALKYQMKQNNSKVTNFKGIMLGTSSKTENIYVASIDKHDRMVIMKRPFALKWPKKLSIVRITVSCSELLFISAFWPTFWYLLCVWLP